MSLVVIVSGPPGSGKTSVSALLAHADPRGLHIPSDLFYDFPAHPVPPYRAEANEQNAAVIKAVCRAAASFASDGYRVCLDGVLGPWFLPLVAREFDAAGSRVAYVRLDIGLDEALARVNARSGPDMASMVRTMHAAFEQAPGLESHGVPTADRPPEAVAREIEGKLASGALQLDLKYWAARGL